MDNLASVVHVRPDFNAEGSLLLIGAFVLTVGLVAVVFNLTKVLNLDALPISPYIRFVYGCFLKPHDRKADAGQQGALESFYAAQANIYDATRKQLLRGREDMLSVVAAQIRSRRTPSTRKPVWYDIGGGTGYNIEIMDKMIGVEATFEHVYLVDLSTSLCKVARERVKAFGWKNVTVLCEDARRVQCPQGGADLITMSYSLSMIPDYYSVVDLLTGFLAPHGLIGVVDFYVQSVVDISSRNYTGGSYNRHVNWIGRMFWRTWFEADRVNLDAGRRDYVEYRFGTVLSASQRNYPLGGIPYYLFIGCNRESDKINLQDEEYMEKYDAALTESPTLSPGQSLDQNASRMIIPRSKSYDSVIVNLSSNLPLPAAFYQQHDWRIYYNDLLAKHQQFGKEYIYAFTWEDPRVDRQLLNINKDDVILAITSAGDNVMDYLMEQPKRIHAVDLNPNQNHLLELKVAAFTNLDHTDCWKLFGEGYHEDFRGLLINKLSPHLSSNAFQFWLNKTRTFKHRGGLYRTGGSGYGIALVRRLFKMFGLTSRVSTFCEVETLAEQRELWPRLRDVLLGWPLHRLLVSSEWWAWKAAGVPAAQRQLILNDFAARTGRPLNRKITGEAIWQYVVDTFDPVAATTQVSRDNYFYYMCLQGRYSKKSHPRYMGAQAHAKLSKPGMFDGLRIHTDEINEVIDRMAPSTLTIAVIMDSMDWFDPAGEEALKQILALNRVLKVGGRAFFRSAAYKPWYTDIFAANGFKCVCAAKRDSGKCIDRVNMYASTWICTKIADQGREPKDIQNMAPLQI